MRSQNQKIARNSVFLYLRTFFSIVISLYTSRVFLEMLGVEDFGIYNLVGGVIALFSIVRGLLSGSIQRFLNVDIGRGDKFHENKVFDISLVINFFIIFVFFVLAETFGLWFVTYKLNIPEGKELVTIWVYHFSVATTMVSMCSVPYSAYIIAHERMAFFAWITIFEVILKLIVTLSLFFFSQRLIVFSSLLLMMYLIVLLFHYLYCHKKISMLEFRWYSPRTNNEYRQLLSFSLWTVLGNGACVARDQGISIIFNVFRGVVLNAAMGIVTQISNIYSSLFANVQTAFLPQIVQSSAYDRSRFTMLLQYCTLSSFLCMNFVCLPMIANTDFILNFWLGTKVPEYTVLFVKLFMIKILVVSSSQAINSSLVAVGKIREVQIFFTLFSMVTVLGSYFVLYMGCPPPYAILLVIAMDFVMLLLRLHYMNKHTELNTKDIVKVLYRPCLAVLLVMLPFSFWVSSLQQNWKTFMFSCMIITLGNILICYYSLESNVRRMIMKKLLSKVK